MAIQSGRDTLASIDHALAEVDRHMGEVDAQIRATSEKIVTLRQQETRLYETLAKLRIDLMATGKLAAELDSAHRQASSLLDDREQALTDLRQRIGRSEATRTALQERRARSAAAVDAADERLDAAQASAQTHLSADSAYQQQLALAQEADRVAELAEEKTRVAEMDRSEKGRPYEQDPLFHYLWERDYGTAQYQGSRLIRRLDDWVARLCGYQTARPNYAMLLEIPRRLREHAQGRRSRADAELQALQQLERGAAGDKGVPAAEQALADARGRLNELDQEIETAEAAHQELLVERSRYGNGEDSHFRKAVALLSGNFGRADLRELRRDAELTPLPDDDVVVEELADLERERGLLEAALVDYRNISALHHRRLQELESLRREFKHHRYDSPSSVFPDGGLITLVLNEFLRGVLGSDKLWREIERNHRTARRRADPGFGSGGIARRRRRGPFGGGFGGGGFGTGGGFGGGGGGFRSGGGF